MGRSKSSPSQENAGASVMMGVLRDTAVQKLQGWMHEYDGPSRSDVPASRQGARCAHGGANGSGLAPRTEAPLRCVCR